MVVVEEDRKGFHTCLTTRHSGVRVEGGGGRANRRRNSSGIQPIAAPGDSTVRSFGHQ